MTDDIDRFISTAPALRFAFAIKAKVAPIQDLGQTARGHRRIIDILGGEVQGPRLSGEILPGGADWQVMARDGALDIEAHYTIESDAGALIEVDSRGLRHGPPDVLARLARGEDVDPSLYYFRTVMRFATGHPSAGWLNRILALAKGAREKNTVKLDVYEVM